MENPGNGMAPEEDGPEKESPAIQGPEKYRKEGWNYE